MTHGSLFAGIGGFDLACHRCGIHTVWAAEKDAKANSVRRKHFPNEETITDVADVSGPRFRVDILSGGFPCQDLSVAGKRAGLAGERSGLFWEFARIIRELAPEWVLIENVPGLLSSNEWRDFGTVLGTLGKLGYGFAYRVLDAQWWGVPQRRRRVFIVGCAGNWRRAAEVLFESESLPWDPPPSREAGAGVAALTANGVGTCGADDNQGQAGHLIPELANGLTCRYAKGGEQSPPLRALSHDKSHANGGGQVAVAYGFKRGQGAGAYSDGYQPEQCPTLTSTDSGTQNPPGVQQGMAVRRLMPIECERLQGFPDGWTQFGEHGEEIADGPRYRMVGNAVAVPVVEWILKRLAKRV